jgi:hypothetical protein
MISTDEAGFLKITPPAERYEHRPFRGGPAG